MHVRPTNPQVPVYPLEPDETGNHHIRVYTYEGSLPDQTDLLIPHRKAYYLLVFIRHADGRQWIDTTSYTLQDNTVYFTGPGQVIVKEELRQVWSVGIAFTPEFLSLQENTSLGKLPLIQHPQHGHELRLTEADVPFVEDMLNRITAEYHRPGDWQQRLLGAYLTLLLTHLSRLYAEPFTTTDSSPDKLILTKFQAQVNDHFQQLHGVSAYAERLGLSAGYLSEAVKNQSGRPAIKHIHERLVLEAKRLLVHSAHSLKEIAFALGFADASYFARFFKRETGLTPANYRQSVRKMYQ